MGMRAFGRWILLKLLRLADDPYKVSMGVGIGTWVNFVPVPGTHTLICLAVCWLLRGSFIAAFIARAIRLWKIN